MGRPCKICVTPGLAEAFDAALKRKLSQRSLARELGVSHHNVRTHLKHHDERFMSESGDESSDDLLKSVKAQASRLLNLIESAAARADYSTQVKAEAELSRVFSLSARLGLSEDRPTGNPTFSQIRSVVAILATELHDYPILQQRILSRLEAIPGDAYSNDIISEHG